MQSQMEAKLASMSLKSPGLKSGLPSSPTARNFSGGMSNFLSPDSASLNANSSDPAITLAQQRAKLKANNASHRISAPALGSAVGDRNTWGSGSNQLGQVDERSSSPAQELTVPSPSLNNSRPKSTDFSGVANAFKSPRPELGDGLSPLVSDSWASMVNTPLMPMFAKERSTGQSLDAAAAKLNDWTTAPGPGVPLISDPPKKFGRLSKGNGGSETGQNNGGYDDGSHHGQQQQQRNASGGLRNVSGQSNHSFGGQPGWNGARSPGLGGNDGNMNGLGVGGFNVGMGAGLGMGLPGTPGFNVAALAGMPMSPFNGMFNMPQLAAMGLSPEQMLAMQMAAAGQLGQPGLGAFMGMQPQSSPSVRSNRSNMRSPGIRSPASARDGKKDEEDVDPKLLEDIPAWLRSLRLHKYTPNFEGMNWKDVVLMDEAALEAKGVAALGARRKMLKTFEVVRKKMGVDASGAALSPA